MLRSVNLTGLIGVLTVATLVSVLATTAHAQPQRDRSGRIAAGPTVCVTSQGLCYDSIVTAPELPPVGPFQQLMPTLVDGVLETEFGPGDPEYRGGRWWLDLNG
ncbi:MAG: hypothetical protein ACI8S3_000909, partial [Alphaproteobacteria bacterium]